MAAHKVEGWGFTESTFNAETATPLHCHDSAFFYLVVAGTCVESCRRSERVSEPSSLVFHPAAEPHANRWTGVEGRCFSIEISRDRASRLPTDSPVISEPARFIAGAPSWIAQRMYHEFSVMDPFSALVLEGLALELVAVCSRGATISRDRGVPAWLRRVRDVLHDHLSQPLGLNDLSVVAGVHPSHLARAFRKHYRCSIGEYQRKARLERAIVKLSSSTVPIAQTALELGFYDQSHFSKTFKRETGLSPLQFQRLHGKGEPDTSA